MEHTKGMEHTTLPTQFLNEDSHPNVSATPYSEYAYDEEAMDSHYTLWKGMNIFSMVIYSLAFVLGVIGNGLVIFITGFRMKRTVNTVWFLNLAIADFAFTLFLPLSITYLALGFHWPFGLVMCKLNSTIAYLNLYASVYLLMIISVDRCISVYWPVWAQNHRTTRLAYFVAAGVWIVALVLCSPNLHFRHTARHPMDPSVINCYLNYSRTDHLANVITRFVFAFGIPFYVIVLCYGMIVLKLRRDRLTQSNRPFKIITAVIVAFFCCWFPYHVFAFIEMAGSPDDDHLHLVLLVGVPLASNLAFINSCLNPILYVFMGHDFKERLKYSLFSVFENAFAEDSSQSILTTKTRSSVELDSQNV